MRHLKRLNLPPMFINTRRKTGDADMLVRCQEMSKLLRLATPTEEASLARWLDVQRLALLITDHDPLTPHGRFIKAMAAVDLLTADALGLGELPAGHKLAISALGCCNGGFND